MYFVAKHDICICVCTPSFHGSSLNLLLQAQRDKDKAGHVSATKLVNTKYAPNE